MCLLNGFEKFCLLVSAILLGNTLFFNYIKIPYQIRYDDHVYISVIGIENDGSYYAGYVSYSNNGIYLFKVTSRFKRFVCMKVNFSLLLLSKAKIYEDCF